MLYSFEAKPKMYHQHNETNSVEVVRFYTTTQFQNYLYKLLSDGERNETVPMPKTACKILSKEEVIRINTYIQFNKCVHRHTQINVTIVQFLS